MSAFQILKRRATSDRDKIAEAVSECRNQLEAQKQLLMRTEEIAMAYQRKMSAMQDSASHFGDLQLYRTSLKQVQQAIAHIKLQVNAIELDLAKKQRLLAQAELERQKYSKLVEREESQLRAIITRQESRELDELGSMLHQRKPRLA